MFLLLSALTIVSSSNRMLRIVENRTAVDDLDKISLEIQAIFNETTIFTILTDGQEKSSELLWKFQEIFDPKFKSYMLYNNLDPTGWQDLCNHHLNLNELSTFHPSGNSTSVFNEEEIDLNFENTIPMDKSILYRNFGYVILTKSADLESRIYCLSFKVTGSLLFIVENRIEIKDLLTILRNSWKKLEFLRIFVLTGTSIYRLDPFLIEKTDGIYGTLIKYSAHKKTTVVSRNMNLFPINVEVFNSVYSIDKEDKKENITLNLFYGPDVTVAKVMMKRMNFTANIIKNDGNKFGSKLANGTTNGAIGNIQKRISDVTFSTFFIKDYGTGVRSDFTASLYDDQLCVVVKKAERVPPELLPLVIFDEYLWLALLLITFLIYVFRICLRWCNNLRGLPRTRVPRWKFYRAEYNLPSHLSRKSEKYQYFQLFIDTWILMLTANLRRIPFNIKERMFIGSICLMSMIFTSMYQSGLATVFFTPFYYKEITSLQQLDESGKLIVVKYPGYLLDTFPENSSLIRKMRLADMSIDHMNLVAHDRQKATITRKSTTSLDNAKFFVNNVLHLVEECPKTYNLAYVVPYHSIYLEMINNILLRIKNGGLIKKWISDFNYNKKLKILKNSSASNSRHFKILNILDLQFPFFVLVFGIGLSFLVMLVEIIRAKKRRGKINVKHTKILKMKLEFVRKRLEK